MRRSLSRPGHRCCSEKTGETDTYIVDIADGSCSCPDGHAPHDANGRKLCKHMIAAMLSGEEV